MSDNVISATTVTGQKLAPSYWANIVACVVASQFGIVTALGMKNNIISCVCPVITFSFLTEVILYTVFTGISFDKVYHSTLLSEDHH
jgi:hypothetical protein